MPKHASLIAAAIVTALAAPAVAQQPSPPAFEKKEFTHSAWTKGIFSEAVTVKGAGRMIFLAGVGSEDENGPRGNIRHHKMARSANMPSTRSSACSPRMAPT